MTSPNLSRRQLLRRLGAAGAGTVAAPWLANLAALTSARASGAGNYRALVCLYMYGGNDAYNTVLATDTDSWSAYIAARGVDGDPVSLPPPGALPVKGGGSFNAQLGGVLPIVPRNAQSRTFAVHPSLGSVPSLFAAGRLAIVPNVGPLVQLTSKTDYMHNALPLPPKLFSHNDQQSVWQSMQPEGATVGWGGAMVDLVGSGNTNPIFTSITTGGPSVWLAGNTAHAYSLSLDGPIGIGSLDGTLFNSAVAQQQLMAISRSTRESQYFEQDHAAVVARSQDATAVLGPAYPGAGDGPWGTPNLPPGQLDPLLSYRAPSTGQVALNPISAQLQAVARMMATQSKLGMSRQIFFVAAQGFDTHSSQNTRHADLMAQLSQALSYWDATTRAMSMDQAVTLFTASDFGRAFASNGNGTDHGWGGHHFVLGGGVKGGDIYGTFPTYGVSDGMGGFSSENQLADGVLLPALAVDQYAATLGTWLGVSGSQLTTVMPNLAHWATPYWNLGFMGS